MSAHDTHEKTMERLVTLLTVIQIKSIAGSCRMADVDQVFHHFEFYALDHPEGWLYGAGLFTIADRDYSPLQLVPDTARLRLWHDRQEYEDFLLLLALEPAERRYLIGV